MEVVKSLIDGMPESFPTIGWSIPLIFESEFTKAITGTPDFLASVAAICSAFASIINNASGVF